jgi:hypothetical protein
MQSDIASPNEDRRRFFGVLLGLLIEQNNIEQCLVHMDASDVLNNAHFCESDS